MASDNVVSSPASGGAVFRTLADSGAVEWPAQVLAYPTTISPGANVLQLVTASFGLPVTTVGNVTVVQATGSNLHVAVDSLPAIPTGTNVIGGVKLVDSAGINQATISAGGAVKVDGSAVTQPVSAATLPLPTGASTSAKQPALGTAGTASTDVITVQGIASMTPLSVSGSGTFTVSGTVTANQGGVWNINSLTSITNTVTVAGSGTFTTSDKADGPVSPGTVAANSLLGGAQYVAAGVTLANNQQVALQCDINGHLLVNAVVVSGGNSAASATGSAVPANADYGGINVAGTLRGQTGVNVTGVQYAADTNIASFGGTGVSLGQATMAASIPVVIASNQASFPISGTVTANQGGSWTVAATQSGGWTVTANAGTNLNTSLLALDTSVNGILVAQGSTTSGEKGPLIQGAVTTAAPSYTTAQTSPLSLNTSGGLRVDGSGVTQPVSGTITANAGSGTFTVSGTVTANAGSGTFTTSDLADGPVSPGTVATKSLLGGAQYVSGGITLLNNQQAALQCDVNGHLLVNAVVVSGGNSAASATGSAVPANADYGGINVAGNLRGQTGVNPTGTQYAADMNIASVGGTQVTTNVPVAAVQSGAWSVTANAGTNLNTSLLALDTSVNGILLAQASTTSGQKGPLIQGAVTTAAPTYTTAQTSPLSLTTAGALRTDASATTQPVSGTITANAGTGTFNVKDSADGPVTPGAVSSNSMLIGGQFNTSAPTLTNTQQAALQVDSSGNLKVNVAAGSGQNAAAGATGSAVPASADYGGLNVGGTLRGQTGSNPTGVIYAAHTDIESVGGVVIALGQAAMAASLPVVIASNQSAVPVSISGTVTVAGSGTFTTSDLADGPVAPGAVATKSLLGGAKYTAAGVTVADGQQVALQCDANGFLKINAAAGSLGNAAASATGSAVPASADYVGGNVGGTLRGITATNPGGGAVFCLQTDISAINGSALSFGQAAMNASIPVVIASNQTPIPAPNDTTTTGTITSTQAVAINLNGQAAVGISISGTWTGSLSVQGTVGGTNWLNTNAIPLNTETPIQVFTANTEAQASTAGMSSFRILGNVATGSATITLRACTGTSAVMLDNPLPAGTSVIGLIGNIPASVTTGASLTTTSTLQATIPVDQPAPGAPWKMIHVDPGGINKAVVSPAGAVSQNLTQVGGGAIAQGHGPALTALRVELPSDGTGQVVPSAATSGGCTPGHYLSSGAANQDAFQIKTTPGQLYYVTAANTNAAARYLKLYDQNFSPTSSNTPVFTQIVPPSNSGFVLPVPVGMLFANGIALRITTGMADNDTGSAATGDCAISYGFK